MCLGIPMRIKEIDGFTARCEAKGVEREVNLFIPSEGATVTLGLIVESIEFHEIPR